MWKDRDWLILLALLFLNLVGLVAGIRSAIFPPQSMPFIIAGEQVRPLVDQATSRPVYFVEKPPVVPVTTTDYTPLILPCLVNSALLGVLLWFRQRKPKDLNMA